MNKKVFISILSVCVLSCLFSTGLFADILPDWIVPLREAVYSQNLKADGVEKLAKASEKEARMRLSGFALDIALCRIEYFKGRAYQNDKKNDDAVKHFESAIKFAEKSLKIEQTASAYELISASTMELCKIKDRAWVLARQGDIQKNADLSLALNGGSGGAQFLSKSRWVFSGGTYADMTRGVSEMSDLLNKNPNLQKDDLFNINMTIAYAYLVQKKTKEAEPWLKKALEYYPTNQYAADLLSGKIILTKDSI
ncbi:hypothetical protein FACS1894102_4550 [Spirochaetia bacterium]|nr:hypothetical protein FACS1894102_4550 [Spirochaetia bacterium]